MAKLTLSDLASLQNETSAIATLNDNNDALETALENTLSRDGTTPNTMGAPLDMNSFSIINLPEPSSNSEPLRLGDAALLVNGTGGIGGSTGVTDNRILRSDGTGGATIQNSPITASDTGFSGTVPFDSASIINWNNGDVTLTHSSNLLALAGGGLTISSGDLNVSAGSLSLTPSAIGSTPLILNQFSSSQTASLLTLSVGSTSAASGGWILLERPAAVSNLSRNWRMIVNQSRYNDGSGVGGENYTNQVMAMGWNLSSTVASPVSAGSPLIWDGWEDKFNLAGKYHHERHIETLDTSGVRHRIFSLAAAHDGTTGTALLTGDTIAFYGFDDVLKVQWINSSDAVYLGDGSAPYVMRFQKNNAAPLQQLNAAGTDYVEMIRVNGANVVLIDSSGSGSQTGAQIGIGTVPATTSWLTIAAGTTAKSQINLPTSTAPTSPVDGDIWRADNTNTGLKVRINGVTKTITVS